MSVFTHVERPELEAFLKHYAVGELEQFEGIAEGIENSNFFVDTSGAARHFVLTLFERTEYDSLPYFLGVMEHLAQAGIPTAQPLRTLDGELLSRLNERPAALVLRLPGHGLARPTADQCAQTAAVLARMHLAGADFPGHRDNCRGRAWWQPAAQRLAPCLSPEDQHLLNSEMEYQAAQDSSALPGGVIHADLFRDNVLFDHGQLTGLIDFYYACNDSWLYDLAVMTNDWAINVPGGLDRAAYAALIDAYAAERDFNNAERAAWNGKLRAAALRFWVSRLVDWHFPRAGELTYRKDPCEFQRLLEFHRANQLELR